MFFESDNIFINILSVLDAGWDKSNAKSNLRPYHALSFRKHGTANFVTNGKTIPALTGDIMFVPALCEYVLKSDAESLFVVHFNSSSYLPKNIKSFKSENPNYFERNFSELYNAWTRKQFGYEYECVSIMYKIICKIERENAERHIPYGSDKISEAVEYLHENFLTKGLSVEYLAKMCGMSDTYFRKLFFDNFGVSPRKYINDLKLKYASELLTSGYYTIREASEKAGFENVYYFSTFIKKQTGLSPTQYIKNHKDF